MAMSDRVQDDDDEPDDGRLFGHSPPEDGGSITFESIPEGLTEKAENICRMALLHREMPIPLLVKAIRWRYYDGDLGDAPLYSYTYRTLHENGLASERKTPAELTDEEMQKYRTEITSKISDEDLAEAEMRLHETNATLEQLVAERDRHLAEVRDEKGVDEPVDESADTDDGDGPPHVRQTLGLSAYEGPEEGIDMTYQNIDERPLQGEDVLVGAEQRLQEDETPGPEPGRRPLPEAVLPFETEQEAVTALRALAADDNVSDEVITRLARRL